MNETPRDEITGLKRVDEGRYPVFDVLRKQEEGREEKVEDATLVSPFANAEHPTELSPDIPTEYPKSRKDIFEDAGIKSEEYHPPRELLDYIVLLMRDKTRPKLDGTYFDIDYAGSNEHAAEQIKKAQGNGRVSVDEAKTMLSFLGVEGDAADEMLSSSVVKKETVDEFFDRKPNIERDGRKALGELRKVDENLLGEIKTAVFAEDYDKALAPLKEMESSILQARTAQDIIDKLLEEGSFYTAREFANVVRDADFKEQIIAKIEKADPERIASVETPKSEINQDKITDEKPSSEVAPADLDLNNDSGKPSSGLPLRPVEPLVTPDSIVTKKATVRPDDKQVDKVDEKKDSEPVVETEPEGEVLVGEVLDPDESPKKPTEPTGLGEIIDAEVMKVEDLSTPNEKEKDKGREDYHTVLTPLGPVVFGGVKQDERFSELKLQEGEVATGNYEKPIGPAEPEPVPLTPEQQSAKEKIDEDLHVSRSEYATEQNKWKNSIREKKSKFKKILSDLGVDKQLPKSEDPPALVAAREKYIEAKRKKFDSNRNIIEKQEQEFIALHKAIVEAMPPLEKGIIGKSFAVWSKAPVYVRTPLAALLIGGGVGFAFGGLTLGGAAVYGGYRAARALGGAVASGAVGKYVDGIFKKSNKKSEEVSFENYAMEVNDANFARKEKELMAHMEKIENKEKKQRLMKAGAMAVTGGVASLTLGSIQNELHHLGVIGGGKGVVAEGISKPKVADSDVKLRPNTPSGSGGGSSGWKVGGVELDPKAPVTSGGGVTSTTEAVPGGVEAGKALENMPEVKVSLDSKGFIQDIHNLKEKIVAQYGGDVNKVPQSLRDNFINKRSVDLAKQFHLYDPEHNLSGKGYVGEQLGFDSNGNLFIEHNSHSREILFEGGTKKVNLFGGEMFVPKKFVNVEVPTEVSDIATRIPTPFEHNMSNGYDLSGRVPTESEMYHDVNVAKNIDFSHPAESDITSVPEVILEANTHIPYNDSFVDVVDRGGVKTLMWNDAQIAHEQNWSGGKLIALEDRYQNIGNKEIKGAFNVAFEKNVAVETLGKQVSTIPFEDGKIHVVHGTEVNPNEVKVLLNGKEIAKGLVTEKGPKIEVFKNLKGGWLLADTVYERAFNKHASKIIKGFEMIK